jgi:hypothetical protein
MCKIADELIDLDLFFSSLSVNPVHGEIIVSEAVSFLSHKRHVSCSKVVLQDRKTGLHQQKHFV